MLVRFKGKTYKCIGVYDVWYRVIDETDEDYLYPKTDFDVIDDSDAVYIRADKRKNIGK